MARGVLKLGFILSQIYPNGEFSLGLSMPVKSHTAPPKSPEKRERKGHGFSSCGRRMVRNGAWWLQDWHGRESLSFLTATLPDEAIDLMEMGGNFSKDWSEAVRQFEQWLKRRLEKAGLMEFIVGVTEVQEKRWRKTGKVGLHLHWVFQGRTNRNSAWAIKKEEFAQAWNRILSNVLGERIESNSATRVERVKKSVENYLSKYMSKGGQFIKEIVEAGKLEQLPSAWWNVTHALRRVIRAAVKSISLDAKSCLYESREELKAQGIIQWFYVHEVEWVEPYGESVKVPVAFIGKFSRPEFADMFDY